jgi:hypothetical protein
MSDVPEEYKMSEVGVILDGYKKIKMDTLPVDWKSWRLRYAYSN